MKLCEGLLMSKDREILELKSNIAELLAVMPGMGSHNHVSHASFVTFN
jgi:hypothetical protein